MIRKSWQVELVERSDSLLVFRGIFDRDVSHPDLGLIKQGTISYEYYWLDRWYNIFRFHEADGELRNYYCNISMPAVFENGVLDYVDLDIDFLIWPDGRIIELDREEFEANATMFRFPESVLVIVDTAVKEVRGRFERNELP